MKTKILLLTNLLILCLSCTKIEIKKADNNNNITSVDLTVSKTLVENIYSSIYHCSTKSNSLDIQTISCGNGTPGIYIVNGDSGAMLVSASKAYYPVLAVIPDGITYAEINRENPISVLIDEYLGIIAQTDTDLFAESANYWQKFSSNQHRDTPLTKTYDSEYDDALIELTDELESDGYDWCFLNEQPSGLPDDIYERFCSLAQDNEDYRYDKFHSIIAYRDIGSNHSVRPLLSTRWHQNDPYNSALTNNDVMGCVTIAVAQIMKYHEYPSSINWSDMPDTYASNTLCTFLANLREQLDITHDGGGSYLKANSVLRSYGYSTKMSNHISSEVMSSLKSVNSNPVYMRGINSDGDGHAWVCDGYNYYSSIMEYSLYIISPDSEPLCFEYLDNYTGDLSQILSLHMNWGWSGPTPGWFLDASFPQSTTANYNFSSNRKNIIITKP